MVNQSPLTSPQLSQLQQHYESQLSKIVSSMNLRKWAIEQAFGVCASLQGATQPPVGNGPVVLINDPMALAAAVYEFITADRISPPEDESQ
jgi:hypothetical protein